MARWRRKGGAGRVRASIVLVMLLSACTPKPPKPDPADVMAARQAALQLDAAIRTRLLARLDRGEDPVAVYTAYRDTVRDMTAGIAKTAGVALKRVAENARDPANTADAWERRQLAVFAYWIEAGVDAHTLEASEIVAEGEVKYFRWMRPIVMDETCMTCHGDAIGDRLLALLVRDFPNDEATGFFEGDLAGAYSVKKVIEGR